MSSSEFSIHHSSFSISRLPTPQAPVTVRAATMDDLPFLDSLQKRHGKQLGFFPRTQMQGYVENGWVLVAEDAATNERVGYCASRDRYLKRDELGIIYQLCVAPGHRRGLVGATLVGEAFARSAYGCRLYCCWCAQDLEANRFWESLGFVPLAFRAGSDRKRRVHIFWQKRIVEGDVETKWWYPFQTNSGAIRQDRLVLPIPPGVHWSEVSAPEVPVARATSACLPDGRKNTGRLPVPRKAKPAVAPLGGFKFQSEQPAPQKTPRAKAPKAAGGTPAKIDPKYLKAARELRDRWLEQVNAGIAELPAPQGKYDLTRRALPPMPAAAPGFKSLPHAA